MQFNNNKDIIFIINPNSGCKKIKKYIREIKNLKGNISFVITNNLEELKDVFNTNIEKYKFFILVGGDGTVNEALKYLYSRNDKFLGVLPAGSGNGFSRELGFKKSIVSLINDIKKGESMNIDVLSVNKNKCINIAGVGFDSYIAHCFAQSKSRGLKNYLLSTIKTIFVFKPFNAILHIDNKEINGKFQMISIANTRQFGNNALIAPLAKPNDGFFDLVLIKPFPFFLYPTFITRLFLGSLKDSKYIKYIKVKEIVEIESDFKKYHIDGEPLFFSNKLTVKMLENKIRIIKTSHNKMDF